MTRRQAAGISPPVRARTCHRPFFRISTPSAARAFVSAWLLWCALAAWAPGAIAQNAARDAASVRALLARAEALEIRDPAQALAIIRQAEQAAESAHLRPLAREARARACLLTIDVDSAAAMPLAEDGILAARAASDEVNLARFLECKGYALDALGKRSEAATIHENAVATAERAADTGVLADTLASRGENRYFHGRYDEAIADLDRAYTLNSRLGRRAGQQYTLNAIANVYTDENVGEYDKAIAYYRQLLQQNEAEGLKSEVATALFNIASAQDMKGAYDAALPNYRRALEIDTAIGNADGIADGERAIGSVLGKQGKPEEALPLIESALSRYEAAGDAENVARSRIARARVLRLLARNREALADLAAAERYFLTENNPRYLARIYEQQADVHAADGDWHRAYDALRAYRRSKEELERRAREEQGNRLRVQFDTAKKEQENRALLIENAHRGEALRGAERVRSLQRLVILLGTAFLALLGTMALQQVHKGRRLRLLAMTDELTGLPNRRNILEFLDRALAERRASAMPLSVVSFDVDHFKQINDAHGHHGGDRVLRALASCVTARLPEKARVGRMGGEEFLVVLPGVGIDAAQAIAEALRASLSTQSFEGFGDDERVTISLGVSETGDQDNVEALLRRVDAALYRAKHEGRDRSVRG